MPKFPISTPSESTAAQLGGKPSVFKEVLNNASCQGLSEGGFKARAQPPPFQQNADDIMTISFPKTEKAGMALRSWS